MRGRRPRWCPPAQSSAASPLPPAARQHLPAHCCVQPQGPGAWGLGQAGCARAQGQGWGEGSRAAGLLLKLGHHQLLLKEEKVPLAGLWAAAQSHGRAQHRLLAADNLPAEQRAAPVRKAAPSATDPGRGRVSPSWGGAYLEPKQLQARPILFGTGGSWSLCRDAGHSHSARIPSGVARLE